MERLIWFAYPGASLRPARTTTFAADGARRYETRYSGGVEESMLTFDDDGRAVAVHGRIPADIPTVLAWGAEASGWRCGITLGSRRDGEPYRPLYLHLLNMSDTRVFAEFVTDFESELRDARGIVVPLTPDFLAARGARPTYAGFTRSVARGSAAYSTHQLARYGRLAPGRYTLTVRHPHHNAAVTLVSNALIVEIDDPR